MNLRRALFSPPLLLRLSILHAVVCAAPTAAVNQAPLPQNAAGWEDERLFDLITEGERMACKCARAWAHAPKHTQEG